MFICVVVVIECFFLFRIWIRVRRKIRIRLSHIILTYRIHLIHIWHSRLIRHSVHLDVIFLPFNISLLILQCVHINVIHLKIILLLMIVIQVIIFFVIYIIVLISLKVLWLYLSAFYIVYIKFSSWLFLILF